MAFQSLPVQVSQETLELLVATVWDGQSDEEIQTIVAIGMAESQAVLNAEHDNIKSGHQPAGSRYQWDDGWAQINSIHGHDRAKLGGNPEFCAAAALGVYELQGFDAWVAYKGRKHIRYMGELSDAAQAGRIEAVLHGEEVDNPRPTKPDPMVRVVRLRKVRGRDRYYVEVVQLDE